MAATVPLPVKADKAKKAVKGKKPADDEAIEDVEEEDEEDEGDDEVGGSDEGENEDDEEEEDEGEWTSDKPKFVLIHEAQHDSAKFGAIILEIVRDPESGRSDSRTLLSRHTVACR
ncbi:hypothetical protein T492DRAFT_896044 [Pavlovales sp. CCMP2436]|nr:hypothetical protein T492DRAFT_896044 [Pavlovales sp. CCMP2436]